MKKEELQLHGSSDVFKGYRHHGGDWHRCGRSDIRTQISELQWEQGTLVNPKYSDTRQELGLLGSRDADISRRIEYATSDLQPDPKLSQDNEPDSEVFFA